MYSGRLYSILFAAVLLGDGVAAGATLQAAAGCAPPPVAGTGNVFYIDPVNGSAGGDGSQAHPWNSLAAINGSILYSNAAWQLPGCNNNSSCTSGPLLSTQVYTYTDPVSQNTVTSVNPNAPIKPGDTILLMSGTYGNVSINGVSNPSFITIAAAPGQTPILNSLQLDGSANWVVQGLIFRALANGYAPFIDISGNSTTGAGHDIIIDGNNLASQDNVDTWSQSDWVAYGRFVAIQADGGDLSSTYEKCIAITNNTIKNVRWGIALSANNILADSNMIDNFGDDAVDFAGSNLIMSHNTITNNHDIGDSNHNDAMQGQAGRGVAGTVYSNITINGNIVVAKTNPSLAFPGGLQGIDAFDMDWSNLTVINNVVVTNAYHGISFYSVHGGLIANNTVLASTNTGTWIGIFDKSHQGSSSDNVIVRNNIVSNLDTDSAASTITFDHNLVATQIAWWANGQAQWLTAPGTYGNQNVIDPNGLSTVFKLYNNSTSSYDLHLLAGSLAVGTGNPVAPLDMFGYMRPAPVDLGAYELVGPTTMAASTLTGSQPTTNSATNTTSAATNVSSSSPKKRKLSFFQSLLRLIGL